MKRLKTKSNSKLLYKHFQFKICEAMVQFLFCWLTNKNTRFYLIQAESNFNINCQSNAYSCGTIYIKYTIIFATNRTTQRLKTPYFLSHSVCCYEVLTCLIPAEILSYFEGLVFLDCLTLHHPSEVAPISACYLEKLIYHS